MRLKIEKKDKFLLYDSINEIINKLEEKNLINDQDYCFSKIRFFCLQGKSKIFIKSYFIQKGVEKLTILNSFENYEITNPDWEKNSAMTFIRKKRLIISLENKQKNLNKMSRAGFDYNLCKDVLNIN